MDLETYLTAVYCLVDDLLSTVLHGARLRQRGPAPTLADSEVVALCVAGEFLGLAQDAALYRYFRRHHRALFPRLACVHRTTFLRQAAALGPVVTRCWQHLTAALATHAAAAVMPALSLVDSMPMPVCRMARAARCRRFAGEASVGYDPMARQPFYGFRLHVRVTWPGLVTALTLAPAHVHDVQVAPQLLAGAQGWVLGDRAYWSPTLRARLAGQGLVLLAPFKHRTFARRHPEAQQAWTPRLTQLRRRIETVLSQFAERFSGHRVWARDAYHLYARLARKLLAHTVAVWCCLSGLADAPTPLAFARLLRD